MTYEVELKYRLDDEGRILDKLDALTAQRGRPIEQYDRYFNHPGRDFAETDEALRIRSVDGRNFVTYKGPLVDSRTKTRREIEVPIGCEQTDADRFAELLSLLGFHEVRTVVKNRIPYELFWEDRRIELAFDRVLDLGNFLEIETIAEQSDLNDACDSILRLAGRLDLEDPIRKSYLTLLLQKEND